MSGPPRTARFFVGEDMDEGVVVAAGGGLAAVFTRSSPTKPTGNEDAAAVIPFESDGVVLAVADGVGSTQGAARASAVAVREIAGSLVDAARNGAEVREAVLAGFDRADQAIASLGSGAATTLAVVVVQGRAVRTFHVGDTVALVTGQRGRLKLQTISHSPVGYAVEAGIIDEDDAIHHAERHLISNAVGLQDMRVEMGPPLELATHDTVVVGSDGLFDNLLVEEIVDRVRKGSLESAIAALASTSLERMARPSDSTPSKADDLTFIAYRLAAGARASARDGERGRPGLSEP